MFTWSELLSVKYTQENLEVQVVYICTIIHTSKAACHVCVMQHSDAQLAAVQSCLGTPTQVCLWLMLTPGCGSCYVFLF
jgi:hypothetical protein